MELKLTTTTTTTLKEADLSYVFTDPAALWELIKESGLIDAAEAASLDADAVIDAVMATPEAFDALLAGDGAAALEAALNADNSELGFGTGLPDEPDFGDKTGVPGSDGSLFDGGDTTGHVIGSDGNALPADETNPDNPNGQSVYEKDGVHHIDWGVEGNNQPVDLGWDEPSDDSGWHTDTGTPNYLSREPGTIVYDANGNEIGVVNDDGAINSDIDGEDTDGDGKADTATDKEGNIILFPSDPEAGHNEDDDANNDGPIIITGTDGNGNMTDGNGNPLPDTEEGGDDTSGDDTSGGDTSGDDTSGGDTSGDDEDDNNTGNDGTSDGGETPPGDDTDEKGTTPQDPDGGGGTAPDDLGEDDVPGNDGTTQPGAGDDESGGTVTLDTDTVQPGYGTTQPGIDEYGGEPIVLTVEGPGYGLTQPGLDDSYMVDTGIDAFLF